MKLLPNQLSNGHLLFRHSHYNSPGTPANVRAAWRFICIGCSITCRVFFDRHKLKNILKVYFQYNTTLQILYHTSLKCRVWTAIQCYSHNTHAGVLQSKYVGGMFLGLKVTIGVRCTWSVKLDGWFALPIHLIGVFISDTHRTPTIFRAISIMILHSKHTQRLTSVIYNSAKHTTNTTEIFFMSSLACQTQSTPTEFLGITLTPLATFLSINGGMSHSKYR